MIIEEKMSPYAAAETIKKSNKFTTTISYKTIYNYIDQGIFQKLTNKHLPVKSKKNKSQYHIIKELDKLEREMGAKKFRETFKTITCDNGCENLDFCGI